MAHPFLFIFYLFFPHIQISSVLLSFKPDFYSNLASRVFIYLFIFLFPFTVVGTARRAPATTSGGSPLVLRLTRLLLPMMMMRLMLMMMMAVMEEHR